MGEGRGAVGNDQCIFAAQDIIIINQILDFVNGRRIYPFNKGLRIYGGVYHPLLTR